MLNIKLSKSFSLLLSVVMVLLGIFIDINPALAKIIVQEEAPQQVLLQARHRLEDNKGNLWQIVLFKRTTEGIIKDFNLRLVAFPDTVNMKHPAPLLLQTISSEDFKAQDLFSEKAPGNNIGQYDVAEILPQVIDEKSLILEIPVTEEDLFIRVPYPVMLEWQEIVKS